MPDVTVLISGAGTVTCQSVMKGLRSHDLLDVCIITMDMQNESAGRYFSDKFFKVPSASDPAFLQSLLDICKNEKVDLLVPIVDYEFDVLSKNKEQFSAIGTTVAISSPEVIDNCNDKWKTYSFFKELKIPTPTTYLPENLPSEIDFPVFLKPRIMGRSSLDTYLIKSKEMLDQYMPGLKHPLIQQAIEGQEYTIDLLCNFEGKMLNAVIRERIETKSGVSYKGRTVKDEDILNLVVQIAEGLPIIGPANMQCFKNAEGISFIEINPRFSGALALSLAAGFNSPLMLAQLVNGEPLNPDIGNYQPGVMMMRYWQEVFVDGAGKQLPSFDLNKSKTIA